MGNKKLSIMKSIIFFTLFNMIAYISSKSHSKKLKTTSKIIYYGTRAIPTSNYCMTTLLDDDASGKRQNPSYYGSFGVNNLPYDLEDDLKEVYFKNRLSPAQGKYYCNYKLLVCKNNNYGNCVTYTGELKPGVQIGLKATYPQYASYFGDADSVKNTITMVDRNPPAPVVVKPVVKPEQTPIIASTGTTQDDVMERHIGTRRK